MTTEQKLAGYLSERIEVKEELCKILNTDNIDFRTAEMTTNRLVELLNEWRALDNAIEGIA